MAQKAPGKYYRNGLTWPALFKMFPTNAAAEKWFVEVRWPNGVGCPKCGSLNVLTVKTRKPQPYRCRDCRKCFSVKTGTLMQSSNLGLQTWAIALYILTTGIKGTSSMKMHRDVGVTQKTAWHLAHRIRDTWRRNTNQPQMGGPVEADEPSSAGRNPTSMSPTGSTRGAGRSEKPPSLASRIAPRTACVLLSCRIR